MPSEAQRVEEDWAALLPSLGSAGVLARHALLFIPGRNRPTIPSGGELLAKEFRNNRAHPAHVQLYYKSNPRTTVCVHVALDSRSNTVGKRCGKAD